MCVPIGKEGEGDAKRHVMDAQWDRISLCHWVLSELVTVCVCVCMCVCVHECMVCLLLLLLHQSLSHLAVCSIQSMTSSLHHTIIIEEQPKVFESCDSGNSGTVCDVSTVVQHVYINSH